VPRDERPEEHLGRAHRDGRDVHGGRTRFRAPTADAAEEEFAREPTSAPDARATRREARERTRPIPDASIARARLAIRSGETTSPERPPARPSNARARARETHPPSASTPTVAISFYSKMPCQLGPTTRSN
jgi:hypothetical protein